MTGGTFDSSLLPGVSFSGAAQIPVIEVLSEGSPVDGVATFSFSQPATSRGASWRYLVGIGGTGGVAGEGPTSVTRDAPLVSLGQLGAFGTGATMTFVPPATLSGGSGGGADGVSLFVLDGSTLSVTCTSVDGGTTPDQHVYAVGMVSLDVSSCQGVGSATVCLGNTCGDGIKRDGEMCDDGNVQSNDGCSDLCTVEPTISCAGDITSLCAGSGASGI